MAGAGFSRAGLDPAGHRSPDHTPATIVREAALCRAFDTLTHDYTPTLASSGGDFASQSIVLAKVTMALGNKPGTFAWDPSLGDPSLAVDRDGADLPRLMLAYAQAQLKPMIDAGEITLDGVEVVTAAGQLVRIVHFTDISTGQKGRVG